MILKKRGSAKVGCWIPYNFTSVLLVFNLMFIIDILIIEWIHPSEHATGYYAAILVISTIMWEVPKAITLYLAPKITPLLKTKKYHDLQLILNTTNRISLPVIAVLFIIIVIFSYSLLAQFGPMYTHVQAPLIILCTGYLIGATALANARILMFIDSKLTLILNITQVGLLVVFGIVLTYFFGLIGMSLSVLIASTCNTIIMYYFVNKKIPIKPFGIF